jgi:hypothetical protein
MPKFIKGQSSKRCRCGERSLTGLVSDVSLCQYHYNVRQFGKEWADKCKKEVGTVDAIIMQHPLIKPF